MDSEILRYYLPLLLILYSGAIFVWHLLRQTKPHSFKEEEIRLTLVKKWNNLEIVNNFFQLLLFVATIIVLVFIFSPELYSIFLPIYSLEIPVVNTLGVLILILCFVWVVFWQFKWNRETKNQKMKVDTKRVSLKNVYIRIYLKKVYSFERKIHFGILCMLCGIFISISSIYSLFVCLSAILVYSYFLLVKPRIQKL